MVRREALVEDHGCGLAGGAAGGAAAQKVWEAGMNRKLLTYGSVVLLALLCAAAFATGVLTRYPVLEAQVQAMDFPNGTAVSLENGDVLRRGAKRRADTAFPPEHIGSNGLLTATGTTPCICTAKTA